MEDVLRMKRGGLSRSTMSTTGGRDERREIAEIRKAFRKVAMPAYGASLG